MFSKQSDAPAGRECQRYSMRNSPRRTSKTVFRTALLFALALLFVICSACGSAEKSAPAEAAASEGEPLYSVTIRNTDSGVVYERELKPGERIVIGRNPSSDIVISDDDYVSRTHCELTIEEGVLYLSDLGSTNGTYLLTDGGKTEIQPKDKAPLQPGDQFLIADLILTLEACDKSGQ